MTTARLNLTQLSTLRELVRRGTLAAAAHHLGYTPGAASQHLAALEATLGVSLVERSGRHLVLTAAGRVMADHAEELLAAEARAVGAVRSAHGVVVGPLVVGTWGSTAATLLAPLVQRMAAAFPDVTVTSREVDLDEVTTDVRHGEVDIAFGLDYPDAPLPGARSVELVRLRPEPFAVAVAPGWGGVPDHRGPVGIDTLAAVDWILPPESSRYGRAVRAGFRRLGFEPRVVHEVTDTAASLQLAAAGLGATVATGLMRRLASVDLQVLPLPASLTRQLVLVCRSDAAERQPVRAFVHQATRLVDQLLGELSEEGPGPATS